MLLLYSLIKLQFILQPCFFFYQLQVGGAYPIPYSYINSPLSSNSVPPHNTLASYSTMSPYYSSPTKMEVCDAFEQGYSCDKRDLCLFAHPGMSPHILDC